MQNTLCRIVTKTHRFSSITRPMASLHWLPVKYRIQFKMCLIMFKLRHTGYPAYLRDCDRPYHSTYQTRKSDSSHNFLQTPYYNRKQHNSFKSLSSTFIYSAPRLWNSLPDSCRCASSISTFRSHLKTHLWTKAYPP